MEIDLGIDSLRGLKRQSQVPQGRQCVVGEDLPSSPDIARSFAGADSACSIGE
ncbi:hypothetical protein [Pseudonocardia sp. MH-G8]|uniref:hypothetical protein n=1 Tax=Pseudonocardia sp. MH-G8 TaxID=1854588 RepID=UPI00130428A5|nr:hypothetical protein [Pseudonocardia sp. MH-G8]